MHSFVAVQANELEICNNDSQPRRGDRILAGKSFIHNPEGVARFASAGACHLFRQAQHIAFGIIAPGRLSVTIMASLRDLGSSKYRSLDLRENQMILVFSTQMKRTQIVTTWHDNGFGRLTIEIVTTW